MPTRRSDKNVGYGRPPVHSRFKPGQSGNPAGRKPKRTKLLEDTARILSEPVSGVDRAGRKRTLRMLEASYLALCKEALGGNRAALIDIIRTVLLVGQVADRDAILFEDELKEAQQKFRHMLKALVNPPDSEPE